MGLAFVLEAVTVSANLDDRSMVQEPVQRCRCQCGIATEGLFPLPKAQIRRQDDRARFIPLGYDLEEQVRLGLAEREIAYLVDNAFSHTSVLLSYP